MIDSCQYSHNAAEKSPLSHTSEHCAAFLQNRIKSIGINTYDLSAFWSPPQHLLSQAYVFVVFVAEELPRLSSPFPVA